MSLPLRGYWDKRRDDQGNNGVSGGGGGAHTAKSDGGSGEESFVTFQDQRIKSDQECSLFFKPLAVSTSIKSNMTRPTTRPQAWWINLP